MAAYTHQNECVHELNADKLTCSLTHWDAAVSAEWKTQSLLGPLEMESHSGSFQHTNQDGPTDAAGGREAGLCVLPGRHHRPSGFFLVIRRRGVSFKCYRKA